MNDIQPEDFVQPLIELLHSAETFGVDFNRPGRAQHLEETLSNVRSLKARALRAVRVVGELMEAQAARDGDIHPNAPSAVAFLGELAQDLSEIESRISNRLMSQADGESTRGRGRATAA